MPKPNINLLNNVEMQAWRGLGTLPRLQMKDFDRGLIPESEFLTIMLSFL